MLDSDMAAAVVEYYNTQLFTIKTTPTHSINIKYSLEVLLVVSPVYA